MTHRAWGAQGCSKVKALSPVKDRRDMIAIPCLVRGTTTVDSKALNDPKPLEKHGKLVPVL